MERVRPSSELVWVFHQSSISSESINEVWVEAGARFNGALLEAGLIDEIIIYVAPCVLGDDSRGMFSIEPFKMLEEKIQFKYEDIRNFGQDIRITACLVES